MSRPKGLPKTGGRQPGTPNRRTGELSERLAIAMGAGWCPVVAMALIAVDASASVEVRLRALSEVAPYLHARRKHVELSTTIDLAEGLKAARERATRWRDTETLALPDNPQPAPRARFEHVKPAVAQSKPRPAPTPKPEPEATAYAVRNGLDGRPTLVAVAGTAAIGISIPDLSPGEPRAYDPYSQ